MPNSLIISWLYSLFSSFMGAVKKSRTSKLFNKIYGGISSSVLGSFTARLFESNKSEARPLTYKIFNFPIYILNLLCRLFYKPLTSFMEKSLIANIGKVFYNSGAALNSVFWGSLLLGFGISGFCFSFIGKTSFIIFLPIIALGILFMIKNINVSDHLKNSFFVKIFCGIFDFKNISFKFYDPEFTKGKLPLITGLLMGILMGAVSFKSFISALLIPFGILAVISVLYYPIVGVFAAVFAAPLVPTMVLALTCLGTLFALFLNKALIKDYKWKTSGVGTALILLLTLLLVSSILGFSPARSIMVWAMYLVFFSFYFVIINTISSREEFYSLLKVFVISGIIVAVYGILQYIFRWTTDNLWIDETMFDESTMRAYSTLENPNVLGEYLLLLLPVTYIFMIRQNSKAFSKLTYTGAFLATAACLIFTQSRGCWLGMLLSFAVIISFHCGKLWALIPLGAAVLPFILPETIIERVLSIGDMADTSTSYRVYIWYGTMEMLKTYFIGGIGMGEGAFGIVYPVFGYNAIVAPHSHNLFLQLTVEAGIGALIVFLAAMMIFIKNNIAVCKRAAKKSYDYLTALAFSAGIAGFLLQSMFDYTFYNYRVMAIFVMYLAFGAVLKTLGKEIEN